MRTKASWFPVFFVCVRVCVCVCVLSCLVLVCVCAYMPGVGACSARPIVAASRPMNDVRGFDPAHHADVPKCHGRRVNALSSCLVLGDPGAVHPSGYKKHTQGSK